MPLSPAVISRSSPLNVKLPVSPLQMPEAPVTVAAVVVPLAASRPILLPSPKSIHIPADPKLAISLGFLAIQIPVSESVSPKSDKLPRTPSSVIRSAT